MNAEEKEILRHTVLQVLASRPGVALNRRPITNRVAMEVDFTLELSDVVGALEFLKSLGHVEMASDAFGSTNYWKATASGILAWERSTRPGSSTCSHD